MVKYITPKSPEYSSYLVLLLFCQNILFLCVKTGYSLLASNLDGRQARQFVVIKQFHLKFYTTADSEFF